jgi:hypothetical protein
LTHGSATAILGAAVLTWGPALGHEAVEPQQADSERSKQTMVVQPAGALPWCCSHGILAGILVVQFELGITREEIEQLLTELGFKVSHFRNFPWGIVAVVRVPAGDEVEFIPFFEALPGVSWAFVDEVGCFDGQLPCECCPTELIDCYRLEPLPALTGAYHRLYRRPIPPCEVFLVVAATVDLVEVESYDLIRGALPISSETSLGPVDCLQDDSMAWSTSEDWDPEIPASGQGFFYLARPNGPDGALGYGSSSTDLERLPSAGDCRRD